MSQSAAPTAAASQSATQQQQQQQQQQAEKEKERAEREKEFVNSVLSGCLDQSARARLSTLALTRPETAQTVSFGQYLQIFKSKNRL